MPPTPPHSPAANPLCLRPTSTSSTLHSHCREIFGTGTFRLPGEEVLELKRSTRIYTGADLPPRFFIELVGIVSRSVSGMGVACGWFSLGRAAYRMVLFSVASGVPGGGGGVCRLECLQFTFCTKFLYASCSVFLRICAGVR